MCAVVVLAENVSSPHSTSALIVALIVSIPKLGCGSSPGVKVTSCPLSSVIQNHVV